MNKIFENDKLNKVLSVWKDDLKETITKLVLALLSDVKTRPSLLEDVEIDIDNDEVEVNLVFTDSAFWVNRGRLPNNRLPPVILIMEWLIKYKITPKDPNMNQLQLAWAISMSIAKNGIRPKPIYDKAIVISQTTTLFAVNELAGLIIDAILEDF